MFLPQYNPLGTYCTEAKTKSSTQNKICKFVIYTKNAALNLQEHGWDLNEINSNGYLHRMYVLFIKIICRSKLASGITESGV